MKKYLSTTGFPKLRSAFLFLTILIGSQAGLGQEIVKEFNAPGQEVRGLAWDGQYLWCAEPQSGKIYQLDPSDGQVISSFDFVLDYQYGGLCWGIDDYLWISDLRDQESWFLKVDPASGLVEASFHCPGG